jgi:inorganic pyrophosphatase
MVRRLITMKKTKRSLKYQCIDPKVNADGDGVTLRAVVETPRGSRHKFALDVEIGALTLKQTLASGLAWPYDYGFIPSTLGKDGDPLDIIVLMDEPTFPGCVVKVRLLGVIGMEKNGVENDRFVGMLLPSEETSLSTDGYRRLSDLPPKLLAEIKSFLCEYSEEKGNDLKLTGEHDEAAALASIEDGARAFEKKCA